MKNIIAVFAFLSISVLHSEIVINEFLAGSDTCCGGDIFDGNTEDFVELYNLGADSININGWGFSDTDGLITTVAPDTSIAPGDFLVLWYTGDNNGFPEINEKLSKNGETIFIADSDGNPMISYDFGPQTDDISYGRNPDGSDIWEYFSIPTPGTTNENTNPIEFQPQTKQELQTPVNLWISDSASSLSTYGEINTWDVSLITDMELLFWLASSFNSDISAWDVSSVTNMSQMFYEASSFNGDISAWDVSSVTDMSGMYNEASSFNQDLSTWDVSSVTNMSAMFLNASIYNMSLSSWNVSNVIYMNHMFENAENFNEDITTWDVSSVIEMAFMFSNAGNFNQNISNWNLSSLNTTDHMFHHASSFNQDISVWDISSVSEMYSMFDDTDALSDENKCAIHNSWSVQSTVWPYDWSTFCALSNDVNYLVSDNFTLHQNYPNPFNPVTSLRYDLSEDGFVNITVYDMGGRIIKTLVNSFQTAGYKSIRWDATNNQNQIVTAGVYIYKIEYGDFVATRKMILLK